VLIFATSDKGGTGRSVTSSNILYRRALQGGDVCYFDFDFGSPTAPAIFQINEEALVAKDRGLHSFLRGSVAETHRIDVWNESDREILRGQPPGAGRLVLFPGDVGGSEFPNDAGTVGRCVDLFLRAEEEFEFCLVDLSAGRSYATEMVLEATAHPRLASVTCRWLVFHRWTRQHIISAHDLVFGERGILDTGGKRGHDREGLTNAIRFVRTAVVDPNSTDLAGLRAAQVAWLRDCNTELQRLASRYQLGRTALLGSVPLDPVLQWREQLVSDDDVALTQIANQATVEAFTALAMRLVDQVAWEGL
jgi:hypothetical protein